MLEFIGKLHPLFVHLPLGAVVILVFFQFIQLNTDAQYKSTLFIIRFSIVSALLSLLTGWLHSDDYEVGDNGIIYHRLSAILFTLFLIALHEYVRRNMVSKWKYALWTGLIFSLFITGELGAKLTHGYNLFSIAKGNDTYTPVAHTGIYFDDVITPILRKKCYSCHSSSKQKGNLRLDDKKYILSGGKHGEIIDQSDPKKSEILSRLFIDISEEDHMPPSGKIQPTDQELTLIKYWVENGASFDLRHEEIKQPAEITELISTYLTSSRPKTSRYDALSVKSLDQNKLKSLIALGYSISPLAVGSPLLQLTFTKPVLQAHYPLFETLSKNIVSLKINDSIISDQMALLTSKFENLVDLDLSHSNITDSNLRFFMHSKYLQNVNISNTSISKDGLLQVGPTPIPEKLFVFNSKVKLTPEITNRFNSKIDTGNYQVSILPGDTSFFTRKIYDVMQAAEDTFN